MNLLMLAFKNWQLVLIVILLGIIGSYSFYVKSLKKEIDIEIDAKKTIAAKLEVSQEAVKSLQGAINEQNAAVEKMKIAADERAKANQAELNRAKVTADTYKQQATDILKNVAPQGLPKCDSANILINSELKRAK